MNTYKDYDYERITTPILWDGQFVSSGWMVSYEGQEVTVVYPDEDPIAVIDELWLH
jgi:hypothetical protein